MIAIHEFELVIYSLVVFIGCRGLSDAITWKPQSNPMNLGFRYDAAMCSYTDPRAMKIVKRSSSIFRFFVKEMKAGRPTTSTVWLGGVAIVSDHFGGHWPRHHFHEFYTTMLPHFMRKSLLLPLFFIAAMLNKFDAGDVKQVSLLA